MDQTKRIDKVLRAVEERIQDEVAALLGADFAMAGEDARFLTKEEIFDELKGKQICAQMDIVGEITGKGCLLVGIKDAIRLGGTLIMLPDSELEEVCGREEYSDELADSFGEIANIIAGSFTKDFEEMYPKACRFIRKEQEIISPAKVEVDSDHPVENSVYYVMSAAMVLEGRTLGSMLMLMPAESFGLAVPEQAAPETAGKPAEEPAPPKAPPASGTPDDVEPEKEKEEPVTASDSPPVGSQPAKKTKSFDAEKHKKKIDRLLDQSRETMSKEIGALIGADVQLVDLENRFLDKEQYYTDHAASRQVLTTMQVVGEREGDSYLSIGLKDAIYLGGVLIMLPPSELETVVNEQEFGEDARDAYGEIANIISGVYTAVFEEQYAKKLRFIRKEFSEVASAKVDPDSDDPIPAATYYASSMTILVEGKQLSKLDMLFPVELLELESLVHPPAEQQPQESVSAAASPTEVQVEEQPPEAEPEVDRESLEKHKKRVDKLLGLCQGRIQDEVSALLGVDVVLTNIDNSLMSKEEFFLEAVTSKQVMANMDVVGDLSGKSYLSVGIKDAIRIGGILIMLPSSELESVVAEEDFGADTEDAYGEIANIISGVYTAIFEEQYTRRIRFVKTDLQVVAPLKVEIGSDAPIADENYYVSAMDLIIDGVAYGKLQFLLPATLFELGDLALLTQPPVQSQQPVQPGDAKAKEQTGAQVADTRPSAIHGEGTKPLDILIVGDDTAEAQKIGDVLSAMDLTFKKISFKDNVHAYIPGQLKAVYLVAREVNEQAFGVAIKISSSCTIPLIAAGPAWTRTKVIKAVKYGVRDILLTPASEQDIEENVDNNLMQMAA